MRGSAYAGSAANLAAYLAFRLHDVREIQEELAVLGLSSLGRTESHVRAGIAAVSPRLARTTRRSGRSATFRGQRH